MTTRRQHCVAAIISTIAPSAVEWQAEAPPGSPIKRAIGSGAASGCVLLTGWWFGTMEFYDFPSIGNNDPN